MTTHPLESRGRIVLDVEIPAREALVGHHPQGTDAADHGYHGQQAVDTLFYRADDHQERYSGQDTLRAQGSAYVGLGTRIHVQ